MNCAAAATLVMPDTRGLQDALAVELDGRLLVPSLEGPKVGCMAVLRDAQGALISVMQCSKG